MCLTNCALYLEDVWENECIDPYFLDLGTSFEVSDQLHALASLPPGEESSVLIGWIEGWLGLRAVLHDIEKGTYFTLPGLELRILGRAVRSQFLYRLRYRGLIYNRLYSLSDKFEYNWQSQWSLLWSSGQSSGLQIQRFGLDSRRYQIYWEVLGLEWGPLCLVSTIEELLGRNCSGFSLDNREYGRGDALCCPRNTLYPQELVLTSMTSSGFSAGIFRSRTKATEFVCLFVCLFNYSSLLLSSVVERKIC
jgi:hypothetical protein